MYVLMAIFLEQGIVISANTSLPLSPGLDREPSCEAHCWNTYVVSTFSQYFFHHCVHH